MTREQKIEKVRKLLSLSKDVSNENEAMMAALKAQKIIADEGLLPEELLDEVKEVEGVAKITVLATMARNWKNLLAPVIAKNFRCKVYRSRDHKEFTFIGLQSDAEICAQVFEYLVTVGHRLADRYFHAQLRKEGTGAGCYTSWIAGYLDGLTEALNKQCTALALIVPKEVDDEFKKMHLRSSTVRGLSPVSDTQGYNQGFVHGRSAMGERSLKG